MQRFLAAYAGTATVMVALDLLWLGVIAQPLYQQGIGHLMAEQPVVPVAVLFYLLYALGVVVFAVAPQLAPATPRGWAATLGMAVRLHRLRHLRPDQPGHAEGLAAGPVADRHGVGHGGQHRLGRRRQGRAGLGHAGLTRPAGCVVQSAA